MVSWSGSAKKLIARYWLSSSMIAVFICAEVTAIRAIRTTRCFMLIKNIQIEELFQQSWTLDLLVASIQFVEYQSRSCLYRAVIVHRGYVGEGVLTTTSALRSFGARYGSWQSTICSLIHEVQYICFVYIHIIFLIYSMYSTLTWIYVYFASDNLVSFLYTRRWYSVFCFFSLGLKG